MGWCHVAEPTSLFSRPLKTLEFFPRKGIQFNSVEAVLSPTEERTPNMTISIGDIVEVCRREAGSFCWLEAKVLSINGRSCEVRYENLSDNDGEPISEVVSSALVRPAPPAMQASGKPKVGDHVEVYEDRAWKRGKIIAALPMKHFIIRLLGSYQEKKCHLLNLRPCLSWGDCGWVSTSQLHRNDYSAMDTIDLKRRLGFPSNRASQIGSRKRKAIHIDGDQLKDSLASWSPQVDSKTFPRGTLSVKRLNATLLKNRSNGSPEEADNRTSVASCSGRCFHECTSYATVNDLLDDAQSDKVFENGMNNSSLNKKEAASRLRELQLNAYRSMLRAFYVSGYLTWDKELLLTDLRQVLDISTDEHLSELTELSAPTF